MVCPGSLAPQPLTLAPPLVNNVYVTAEITYSTVHIGHELLAWSRGTHFVMSCFVLNAYGSVTTKPWLRLRGRYMGAAA